MTMMGTETPMTIRFKNGGKTQSTDIKLTMFGVTQHNRNIMDGNKVYDLDMMLSTYKETELTAEELEKHTTFLSDEKIMAQEGMKKGGKIQFLGKTCQIYTMDQEGTQSKFLSWEGLVLKMETTTEGMTISLVAKSITESEPDASYFEIPSGFTKIE